MPVDVYEFYKIMYRERTISSLSVTSYNQGASRPDGGALRAPVCAVIIRALRALISGRRDTRACDAWSIHRNLITLFSERIRPDPRPVRA